MKKIISAIAVLYLCIANIAAQEIYKDLIERISSVENIFEGKVIKSTPYKAYDDQYILTSNVIQITKVFKGNLECGTVEFITEGGSLNGLNIQTSHTLILKEGMTGVFLANNSSKELSPVSFFPCSNTEKLDAFFEQQSFIRYWDEEAVRKAADMFVNFDSLNQLYNFLELYTQANFIDCNGNFIIPTNNNQNEVELVAPMPLYQKSDYDRLIAHSEYKKTMQKPKDISRANVELTYVLSNPIVTGTSPKYFEFDVMISHNDPNKFFNNGLIRLKYNTTTFGSNIVSNNKIQVSRGTVIQDQNSYDNPIPTDITTNEIAIPLTTKFPFTNLNLYQLGSIAENAVHVKIQIANCNGSAVTFTNQSIMEILSFYGSNSNDTFGTSYDAIIATNSISVPSCVATITSFTPQLIHGGIKEVLTIKGYQFGATQGTGRVYFKNADNGGTSELVADNLDIIDWSDTVIHLFMPSIDSIQLQTQGSGIFRVVNNAGQSANSPAPIKINYSLFNYLDDLTDPTNAIKTYTPMINRNNNGGYKIYIDTTISKNPQALSCVRKAIQDWVCFTKVKFILMGDTVVNSNSAKDDNICIIKMGGPLPANTIMRTTSFTAPCYATGVYYNSEIDIIINSTLASQFFYDSTGMLSVPANKYDFYYAILHELGHAVKHLHVIDPNELMHFESKTPISQVLPANQRGVNLWADNDAIDGGIKSVALSSSAILVNGCSLTPMIPVSGNLTCNSPNRINDISYSKINATIFPNPFSQSISIELSGIEAGENVDYTLTNIHAQIITSSSIVFQNNNENTIHLGELNAGVYFLTLRNKGKISTYKLIKTDE